MSSPLRWFTSSYSSSSGGDCVEVAFARHRSSFTNAADGEVATCPHAVHVRDSKVTDGPAFSVAPEAWSAFLGRTG
ncbi:DUF397 domain-containing protein [Streptomyces griseus]|uniref:DUF397 domain-containing protein n=1 Tax=Streptomyces griseus TaxID=1911 RepID=UPI00378CD974